MTNNISEAAQIKIVQIIAKELGVGPHQVAAAVALLDEGSTVPFIARYRKEATGNLDDTHLRNLDERLLYLRELQERRAAILAAIEHQGKLTDELRGAIETAATKQALEDIYLHYKPKRRTRAPLARMAVQHGVELISIGNGTASRETDKLAAEVIELIASKMPERKLNKIVVSEAGASVYSASAFAASEFPELDVSLRGAVSIARRLQDPLAELVKIDPKSIGVGQYQHDVNQRALARALDATVEDCVNAVGVDVNTASAPLLARVSGLNSVLAKNVVEYRDANGPFPNRKKLRKVPRLGDKTFEQAAGFLRINNGDNPLDRSSVHPEAYS